MTTPKKGNPFSAYVQDLLFGPFPDDSPPQRKRVPHGQSRSVVGKPGKDTISVASAVIASSPPPSTITTNLKEAPKSKPPQQLPPAPKAVEKVPPVPKIVVEEPELKDEARVIDEIPSDDEFGGGGGDEWELLSDRQSVGSIGINGGVFVARAGSVRSLTSFESSSSCNLSGYVPFKIQRTLSSSTIDTDSVGGETRALGMKDVDYIEHIVLPSDTLQGLCLAYKISATRLRQANHFSGNNLSSAPKKLIVPLTKNAMRAGYIRVQDKESQLYRLHAFLAEMPDARETEARAYLELADWIVEDAVRSAREDGEWDREIPPSEDIIENDKSGDIRISVDLSGGVPVGFTTKGAGLSPARPPKPPPPPSSSSHSLHASSMLLRGGRSTMQFASKLATSSSSSSSPMPSSSSSFSAKPTVPIYDGIPGNATKSVRPQDVYEAAPQHNGCGVELKEISKSSSS